MLSGPGVDPTQEPGTGTWRSEAGTPVGCSLVPAVQSEGQSRALEPSSKDSSCWALGGKRTERRGGLCLSGGHACLHQAPKPWSATKNPERLGCHYT